MSPYIAEEAMRCEMAKVTRDFVSLADFLKRLRAAGYTNREIIDHGGIVWKREKQRQQLMNARTI
jgi:hypothetical protein